MSDKQKKANLNQKKFWHKLVLCDPSRNINH